MFAILCHSSPFPDCVRKGRDLLHMEAADKEKALRRTETFSCRYLTHICSSSAYQVPCDLFFCYFQRWLFKCMLQPLNSMVFVNDKQKRNQKEVDLVCLYLLYQHFLGAGETNHENIGSFRVEI